MSKNIRMYLEISEETKRLTMEGLEFQAALRKAKEMYKEKAQSLATTQEKEPDTKTTTDIIPLGTDIDNGDIYNLETGQTIREL